MSIINRSNRVAIIGGASKGLGFGCAYELAKAGADIVMCARNEEVLTESANKIKALGVKVLAISGDMGTAETNQVIIDKTLSQFGKIDILVNNSGGPSAGKYTDFKEEDWIEAFQSILMYNIRMTGMAAEYMKKNSWGRIINITSLSVKEPAETLILSNVFRAGVVAFAKSISKDLIKHNITINNLCPGAFKTDRAEQLIRSAAEASGKSIAEIEKTNQEKLPLGRYQNPAELGAFVNFLCSDMASGITGTTIAVDGGISNSLM